MYTMRCAVRTTCFVKHILLTLFCLVQKSYFMDSGPKSSENYGPYDIEIKSWEVIKGPKQQSIATLNFTIIKKNSDYISYSNLTVLEQGIIEEVRSTVYAVKDFSKSVLWNYRIKEPCSHFFLGPMFEHYMHAENCVIKKGPYELTYNKYEVCKGPKLKDAGIVQFKLQKNDKNEYIGFFNLTVIEACRLEEVKIIVFSTKNGRRSALFNYKLAKLCEHFTFAAPLQFYLHADSDNKCTVVKGSYNFKISISEYAKLFFGKSFYYGNFLFKVTVLSSKGNIMCLYLNVNFNKIA